MTFPAVATGIDAFIEARLGETEAKARRVQEATHGGTVVVELAFDDGPDRRVYEKTATYDPRRVLASVAKDRAILALHRSEEGAVGGPMCAMCNPWRPDAAYPCQTVRLLAAIDADHEAYRPEWKPVAG